MKLYLVVGVSLLLSSCTFLSNWFYVQQYSQYRGVRRVAVFVQRWPVYQQLPNQNDPGADFIKKSTLFSGPWQPAGLISPRAVDILDIDDAVATNLLAQVLTEKGYIPLLSGVVPLDSGSKTTVEEIMAMSQVIDRDIDAFLFCFYSPVVFCAKAQDTPKDHDKRSYGLNELIGILNPGGTQVMWAGASAAQAPPGSISHAFIYTSLTMFRAVDWRPLLEVADSQVGGRLRVNLVRCLPSPTMESYPADAGVIDRLMSNNLICRLRHAIPDSF